MTNRSDPPKISLALNAFGGASILSSILFLGGSFYTTNDIAKAFCLGAFFSGLLGSILLFGFAKVIDLLDTIRQQGENGDAKASLTDVSSLLAAAGSGAGSAQSSPTAESQGPDAPASAASESAAQPTVSNVSGENAERSPEAVGQRPG